MSAGGNAPVPPRRALRGLDRTAEPVATRSSAPPTESNLRARRSRRLLARFAHPAGRILFGLIVAGLNVPAQLSVIPLFFELRSLGLLNSRTGLILVYTANGLPFAIFVLAGFFRLLPRSLYEAAVVDGCGEFAAFWRVLLPLARPGNAVLWPSSSSSASGRSTSMRSCW